MAAIVVLTRLFVWQYFLAQTQAATEAAQALICALLVLGDDVKSAKPLNTAGAGAELAKEQAAELEVIEIAEEAQEIPLPPEILSNELPEVDLPSDEEGFLQLVPEGAGRQQNKEDESSETGPAKATEGTSEDDHAPINGNLMQGVEPDDVDELEMVKETQLFADDATIGQEN